MTLSSGHVASGIVEDHRIIAGSSPDKDQEPDSSNHNWDINDTKFPPVTQIDTFDLWIQGHCHRIFSATSEESRRHTSGWAMRNTNNHNVQILKKSCLGVFLCSLHCQMNSGDGKAVQVTLRPAICDKARRKQNGKSCPNPQCSGTMYLQPCRGHCGYPVTHLWRREDDVIYFQAKGSHDHPPPDLKPSRDQRRRPLGSQKRHHSTTIKEELQEFANKRAKFVVNYDPTVSQKYSQLKPYGDRLCSCPPFECLCAGSASAPLSPHNLYPPGPRHHPAPPPLMASPSINYPPNTTPLGHLMASPPPPQPPTNAPYHHPSNQQSGGYCSYSSFSSGSPLSPPMTGSLLEHFRSSGGHPPSHQPSPYISSAFTLLPGYHTTSSPAVAVAAYHHHLATEDPAAHNNPFVSGFPLLYRP